VARYFLHLKDGTYEVLDPEGIEIAIEAVPEEALKAARDCIAGDVKAGVLDLHYRIEVLSEGGELVLTLPFSDALHVVSPR
jgi:hypothetical protein